MADGSGAAGRAGTPGRSEGTDRPQAQPSHAHPSPQTGWAAQAIWWQVYPLGFTGAATDGSSAAPGRGLRQLIGWLDHLVGLGANGLLLGPVFESATHGYDTLDHLHVDARLGGDEQLAELIAAAHARGVRVLLDGVFNHVARGHPWVRQALADGPGSEAGGLIRWDAGRPATFEGHGALVALNHDDPRVRRYVGQVMTHWLERGADGWRLDAAYAVPTSFWSAVLPAVRAAHPDAWFLGEMIHGDYAAYVAESGLDSVTQYELWKAIWSSLVDRNLWELAWSLTRHGELVERFLPQTFVGNHDVTRIASTVPPELSGHAVALLALLPGIPSVYAGDEHGFRGVKEARVGGDDEIRPAFPALPDGLSPIGVPVYRLHQELFGLRRRHPWVVDATTEVSELSNTAARITVAQRGGGASLVLALNLGTEPVAAPAGERLAVSDPSWGDAGSVPPTGWAVHSG